jgi:hypothetical protein
MAGLKRAMVAGLSGAPLLDRHALRRFEPENQPCTGLAGFFRGQSPLRTIVIFPSKTAHINPG